MSEESPIIAELRQIRDQILSEHDGDLAKLVKYLQRRTEESIRAGRKLYTPEHPQSAPTDQTSKRKAG
jgi:hypothetical protein